ncbi:MAG: OmpA family protein [Bacteroidota bacterium]|nr:OmpA family protein [Bacteroidota bacterium]
MKKILLSVFVLVIFVSVGHSQMQDLFNEQFSDNSNNWYLPDKEGTKGQISDGKMYMTCGSNYASYRFWRTVEIPQNADFEIEAKIKKLKGNNKYYGIVWGAESWDNSYNFDISSSGNYRIWGYNNKKVFYIKEATASRQISSSGNNTLKIKRTKAGLSYYINGTKVYSSAYKYFFGNYVGFLVDKNAGIVADFLVIRQEKREIVTVSKSISKYNKENMGMNINSPYSEIAPVIAPDGKTLYVARARHPLNLGTDDKYDIWYSELQANGKWGKMKHPGYPLNNKGDNVVIAISPDNNTLMLENLYNTNGSFKSDQGISVSYRTSSGWSVPKKLRVNNYYNRDNYESFCPTADRRVLVMSVERDEGYGEKDLYVSFLQANGSYSKPTNMGPVLNSYDNEGTPYIAPDNKTLYFYSNTEPGYGSTDVFVSKRLDNSWTKWSQPKNLGSKINSNAWDVYYTVAAKGDYAYLVSTKNSYGNEDIFRIKLREEEKPDPVVLITGNVYDKKTGKPIGTNIVYENTETGKTAGIARSSPRNGSYKVVLPYGINYEIRAEKLNYFALSESFDLRNVQQYKEVEQDLYLTPIEKEETILLKNVLFYSTKARLLPSSFPELKRLAKIMKSNRSMVIELHGHTESTPGYEDKLLALSKRRVKAVKVYLVNYGISENRIKEKAFGGTRPIADNSTIEGKKKNRRVEFKILVK